MCRPVLPFIFKFDLKKNCFFWSKLYIKDQIISVTEILIYLFIYLLRYKAIYTIMNFCDRKLMDNLIFYRQTNPDSQ